MTEEKTHSKYAPSKSEQFLNCPGSIKLGEKAPPEREGPWAQEGTKAHTALEVMLKNIEKPNEARKFLAKQQFSLEMIDHAHATRNYLWNELRKIDEPIFMTETKVELHHIHEELDGTLDSAIVEEFGLIDVYDYKYGKGVVVEATRNTQMIIYALGAAKKYGYNFTHSRLNVIQPRAEHEKGPIRHWTSTMKDLRKYEDILKRGIEACEKPNAPLRPGSWCKFCKAKVICPAISKKALAEAEIDFKDVGMPRLPAVKSTAISDLGRKLKAAELIEFWIAELRAHAIACLERGEVVSGWKLVEKRGRRHYVNETKTAKEAKKLFGDKAFTAPELLSPAQLEKVSKVAKAFVKKVTSNVSSGHTLAPDSDPREAKTPTWDEFKDVT